jgi:hypothetical protein
MDSALANVMKGTELLAERPDSQFTSTDLVCLNFKVPLRVRQQFKICAARHNLTMTELLLLLLLLDASLALDAQSQSNAPLPK